MVRRPVIDLGNIKIKATNGRQEVTMPHGLTRLSEEAFGKVMVRHDGCPDEDYVRVNGTPYAVGTSAERHGVVRKLTGAAKFAEDYYGVMMAAVMARLWDSDGNVAVYAGHSPGDLDWRYALLEAIGSEWEVFCKGKTVRFSIIYANTWEEPVGGVMNIILAGDGTHYKNPRVAGGRTIVVDVGGGSTDFSAVLPDGRLDNALQQSFPVGINNVYQMLEASLKTNHSKFFKDASLVLPRERVREAVRTGVYRAKGFELDCSSDVQEAQSILLNEIAHGWKIDARGGADADFVALTGGGPVDIRTSLLDIFEFSPDRVIDAEEEAFMHLANARGALKMLRMYEAIGAIQYNGKG